MKSYLRIRALLIHSVFLLLLCIPQVVNARDGLGNGLAGSEYTIYLYNTDEGSAILSFKENMSLIIDVYDGFGLYMPLGTLFAGLYWAPNYKNKDDLFLIMNGLVVSDYIGGWGLIAHDYRFTGMFLFFGYAK